MKELLLTIGALWLALVSGAAQVQGVVRLKGTPPPEIPIQMSADCAQAQPRPPTTRHYVVGKDGGLANVFLVIRSGLQGRQFTPPTNPVVMNCVACQIQPYVVAAQAGQPIQFHNNSTFQENLLFTPSLNPGRNYGLPSGQVPLTTTFHQPEDFIRIKGDAHPWFFGYACIVDHPFFAISGTDGRFQIPDGLLDGVYTIEARHLRAGSVKKEVTVRNGRAGLVELTIELPAKP